MKEQTGQVPSAASQFA